MGPGARASYGPLFDLQGIKPYVLRGHPFMTSARRGRRGQAQVYACGRGRGSSPMWTSTQKIKIPSPLTSYCLLLMQRNWRLFYQNFVFGQKKVEILVWYKLVIGL